MRIVFDLQKFANINNSAVNTIVSGTSDNDTIYNAGSVVTIQAGSGDDSIRNEVNLVKIYGGEGDDTLNNNNGGEITLVGGQGNDYIMVDRHLDNWSGSGRVVQYTYGDGNDTITHFGSKDTLQITIPKGKNFSTIESGGKFYFIFDKGSIVMEYYSKNFSAENVVTIQGGGSYKKLPTGLSYNDDGTIITASKKFKGSAINLTKYPEVRKLNASSVTKKLKITGNSLDNEIKGGTKNDTILGGAGNDTLIGDAGNDVLTGGKGDDVFVYSEGNDVIKDYTEGSDIIKLQDATIKSWKTSGKNIIFTTTKGKITVRNGKGKAITITETKIYSNSSSQTVGLFAENNFVTNDNLSEIVKTNLSPTALEKISPTNFENLTQENNLITYSEK